MSGLDPTFVDLPYRALGDAALSRARALGVSHADFRFERVRYQSLSVRDGVLQNASDTEDLGFAVRVIHRGSWGFASGVVLTPEEAVRVAETAVAVATVAADMTSTPVEIAGEPVYDDVTWVSAYEINPLQVPVAEKAALLIDWTQRLRRGAAVDHARAFCEQVQENKYYTDLAGTTTTQQRVRMMPGFEAMGAGADTFDSMASIAPPVGRGWEYLRGPAEGGIHDWDAEIEQVPELLAEKLTSPSVVAGTYDLVIHPSNLWLTIHESIGHATELDRPWATRPTTPARRSRLPTCSATSSTVHPSCTSPVTGPSSTDWPRSASTTRACRRSRGTSSGTGCSSATSSTGRWA